MAYIAVHILVDVYLCATGFRMKPERHGVHFVGDNGINNQVNMIFSSGTSSFYFLISIAFTLTDKKHLICKRTSPGKALILRCPRGKRWLPFSSRTSFSSPLQLHELPLQQMFIELLHRHLRQFLGRCFPLPVTQRSRRSDATMTWLLG